MEQATSEPHSWWTRLAAPVHFLACGLAGLLLAETSKEMGELYAGLGAELPTLTRLALALPHAAWIPVMGTIGFLPTLAAHRLARVDAVRIRVILVFALGALVLTTLAFGVIVLPVLELMDAIG